MNLKQEHYVFGMIGLAALAVLYFLYRESQATNRAAVNPDAISGVAVPSAVSTSQVYPTAPKLGDIVFNEQAPPEQLYNAAMDGAQLPDIQIDPGSGYSDSCCDDCEAAGTPTTVQHISEDVFTAAKDNLASYQNKVSFTTK